MFRRKYGYVMLRRGVRTQFGTITIINRLIHNLLRVQTSHVNLSGGEWHASGVGMRVGGGSAGVWFGELLTVWLRLKQLRVAI